MSQTRVFPAGEPLEEKWVLMWQTSIMPAPAFWRFDSKEEAEEAESAFCHSSDSHYTNLKI